MIVDRPLLFSLLERRFDDHYISDRELSVGLLLSRLLGATGYESQSRRVDVGRKGAVNSREICKGIAEFKRGDNSEKRGILVTNRLPVHAGTRRYGQRCCAPAISLQVSLSGWVHSKSLDKIWKKRTPVITLTIGGKYPKR
jgi:hypothetical protein